MLVLLTSLLVAQPQEKRQCDIVALIAAHSSVKDYEETLLFYIDSKIDDSEKAGKRDITVKMPSLSDKNMSLIIEEYKKIDVTIKKEEGSKNRIFWCQPEVTQFDSSQHQFEEWVHWDSGSERAHRNQEITEKGAFYKQNLGSVFHIPFQVLHF
jgi:hypothetical protein